MTNKNKISHWWNELLSRFEENSILQTYQWGEVKEQFGWKATLHIWKIDSAESHEDNSKNRFAHHTILFRETDQHVRFDPDRIVAASMVLMREASISGLPFSPRIFYAPRGPLLHSWDDENLRRKVLEDLISFAKENGAIFIKVDPEVVIGYGEPNPSLDNNHPGNTVIREMQSAGWTYSPSQIQFKNTMLLALKKSEEDLLMDMKQKTRYNIRLSDRKGVSVRIG
ncbi:MAG: peptidoglycan bridge formation glycyltransferase FemA/FemB family protein, partial [Aliifodinibius sp.]|nr:aminoacyltransferase [candidate division Zixibacteria bacterium]NIT60579.1 aminoacyltransferase [Fodinibius sp.]NIS48261.1 aminoacyltransferase [candidate division Zixibacteria bacterium]NIU16378.1 aminoacyltransferase [candidate division Zixibacteria bacterium]NIV08497.1 peptidoglycan bridge formation glycyltransferase FemA/FemB family protein [candidate division Zixibacteria bacterium]